MEYRMIFAELERLPRKERPRIAALGLDRLRMERQRTNSFAACGLLPSPLGGEGLGVRGFVRVPFTLDRQGTSLPLYRDIDPHPFVPRGQEQLRERCEEIFHSQMTGLARRLAHVGDTPATIGISR